MPSGAKAAAGLSAVAASGVPAAAPAAILRPNEISVVSVVAEFAVRHQRPGRLGHFQHVEFLGQLLQRVGLVQAVRAHLGPAQRRQVPARRRGASPRSRARARI